MLKANIEQINQYPIHPLSSLDRAELADLLGVSIRTLARWAKNGDGPKFIKLGGIVKYRISEVEDWMNENSFTKDSEYWLRQYQSVE